MNPDRRAALRAILTRLAAAEDHLAALPDPQPWSRASDRPQVLAADELVAARQALQEAAREGLADLLAALEAAERERDHANENAACLSDDMEQWHRALAPYLADHPEDQEEEVLGVRAAMAIGRLERERDEARRVLLPFAAQAVIYHHSPSAHALGINDLLTGQDYEQVFALDLPGAREEVERRFALTPEEEARLRDAQRASRERRGARDDA